MNFEEKKNKSPKIRSKARTRKNLLAREDASRTALDFEGAALAEEVEIEKEDARLEEIEEPQVQEDNGGREDDLLNSGIDRRSLVLPIAPPDGSPDDSSDNSSAKESWSTSDSEFMQESSDSERDDEDNVSVNSSLSKQSGNSAKAMPNAQKKHKKRKRESTTILTSKVEHLASTEGKEVRDFCQRFRSYRMAGFKNSAISLIRENLIPSIRQKMAALRGGKIAATFETISSDALIKFLEEAYPDHAGNRTSRSIESFMKEVDFKEFLPINPATADAIVTKINEAHGKFPECHRNKAHQKQLVTQLFEQIGKSTSVRKCLQTWMVHKGKPKNVDRFCIKFLYVAEKLARACNIAKDCGYSIPTNLEDRNFQHDKRNRDDLKKKGNKRKKKRENHDPSLAGKQTQMIFETCNHCGKNNHDQKNCRFKKKNHKDHNPDAKLAWSKSKQGKAWKKAGHDSLQSNIQLPDTSQGKEALMCCTECKPIPIPTEYNPIIGNVDITSTVINPNKEDLFANLQPFNSDDDYTIPAMIITAKNDLPIHFLLDIGALQGNYISLDLATALEAAGIQRKKCHQKVCSALHGICKETHGIMTFFMEYFNVKELRKERIQVVAKVLDVSFDVIIGLPTIKSNNLVTDKFAHKFSSGVIPLGGELAKLPVASGTTHNANPNGVIASLAESLRRERVVNKSELIHGDPDDDGIEDIPSQEPWNETPLPTESDELDLVHIEGEDIAIRSRIREFLEKFRDRFSVKLRREPVLVPPMELNVDEKQWEINPDNHRPPRVQSAVRQEEIRHQVDDMLSYHVIRPCTGPTSSYSQVLLTPKPQNQYRFCIDYRNLNLVTKSLVWPIPNIQAMIERLGEKHPKYFAVMDLTKGYYQAPLAESSRNLTAFITLMGLYEWLRVPMGLKGAPAYFQRIMATVVLAGLIYKICEIYLDDVIVYAQSLDELIENLTHVFMRLRKHNITLNPAKCRFGMTETEYVGRVINSDGWKFSEEKKAEVFNFRKPQRLGELKSFIGLCEFFHSHVRNFSEIMKPLQDALHGYSKKVRQHKLRFTTEQDKAFSTIQEEIANSATLYFMDAHAPVFLQTDASDYGIGAYLFQVVDGQQRPVAFLSKTLDRTQLRWSTPEKEGYAIYYALKKLEYLIRDIRFTLQTDHKNLIYINDTASPKVVRWKLAIQEYDFEIEHIPGKTNIAADGFSRFCQFPTKELKNKNEEEQTDMTDYVMGIIDEFVIPHDLYKIISRCHNSVVGHHGIQRTYTKIAEYLKTEKKEEPWSHMREYIRVFIKKCPCCQKMSRLKVPIHTNPFTTATYSPMQRIAIDGIGPLPPDENGNQHLLVFIDCFSRYVCLYPVKDVTAKSAAKALLKFVGHFGVPPQFITDNAPTFVNEMIKEFMDSIGTDHVLTMAYSKEENALVERVNKEVMRHMRNIIFDQRVKNYWGDYYPLVERIINSQVHSTTKVSPAQIIYGNAIDLDRGIFLPNALSRHKQMQLSEWTSRMLKAQDDIIRIAREHQEEHDIHHISMHTPERTEFPINSYVLAQYENLEHKPPSKLHPHLKGPYQVVNYIGSIYTVRNLVTNKLEDYHITNLRPFEYDPLKVDPRQVANVDQDMVDIDTILQHRGDSKRKSNMKFLVRWSDGDETWEYWSNVRRTAACHKYLEEHGMKSIIPREFFD